MRPAEFWPETGQQKIEKIEKYAASFQSGSGLRSPTANSGVTELGKPQRQIPRGSSEGNPHSYHGGGSIGPDAVRQLVDLVEQLDWVIEMKAFLRAQSDPRDGGGEAGLQSADVAGAPVYNWAGGATPGGDNAQPPLPPKLRSMGTPKESMGSAYPFGPTPKQGSYQTARYSLAAQTRPTSGALAERYALQRQVAELDDNGQPHLDHGERRRLLALAGQKDAEYRAGRKYDSDRARRYCEHNPGTSYEQALYRLGISEPADLVPIGH